MNDTARRAEARRAVKTLADRGDPWSAIAVLDGAYVFRTRALGATAFGVFDGLAFAEAIVSASFDRRVVEEEFSAFTLNESEPFFRQLLDSTLRHFATLLARKR